MRGLELVYGRGISRRRGCGLGRFRLRLDRWLIFLSWCLTSRFGWCGCGLNLRRRRDDGDQVGERPGKPGKEPRRAENADGDRENHRDADHEAGAT